MQYTDNLKLDLVEGTDAANLMDFYNHSMRRVHASDRGLRNHREAVQRHGEPVLNLPEL